MSRITITDGAMRKNPPAKRKFGGAPSSSARTSAGSVLWRSVRSEAAKTSFQETMKTKIADAARPGSASGSATFTNAVARLQPRVIAASSSSGETPAKTLAVVRTTNGRARAVCAIETPSTVSSMPHWMKMTASGIERMTIGNALVPTTESRSVSPPRNANRASA